jgi:hypothetical protein
MRTSVTVLIGASAVGAAPDLQDDHHAEQSQADDDDDDYEKFHTTFEMSVRRRA